MRLSKKDKHFISLALVLASMSTCNKRTRHGCVIVKAGTPIAVGINFLRNDPHMFQFCLDDAFLENVSTHAEEAALKAIDYQANNCTAYIARINSSGHQAMSRPCAHCMEKLKAAGVNKICYTEYDKSTIERLQ